MKVLMMDSSGRIVHDADVLPKFVDLIMEGLHKVTQHWSNCWCFSLCWASGMLVSDPNPCRPVLIERAVGKGVFVHLHACMENCVLCVLQLKSR